MLTRPGAQPRNIIAPEVFEGATSRRGQVVRGRPRAKRRMIAQALVGMALMLLNNN